jgi:hypothetical protein
MTHKKAKHIIKTTRRTKKKADYTTSPLFVIKEIKDIQL